MSLVPVLMARVLAAGFDSIHPLEKQSSGVWAVARLSSSQMTREPWAACRVAAAASSEGSTLESCASKPTVPPPVKTAPCRLPVSEVLRLLLLPLISVPPLGLQFHQIFVSRCLVLPGRFRGCRGALLSSTGYNTAAPTLASRRPGFAGKALCCWGLHSAVREERRSAARRRNACAR